MARHDTNCCDSYVLKSLKARRRKQDKPVNVFQQITSMSSYSHIKIDAHTA